MTRGAIDGKSGATTEPLSNRDSVLTHLADIGSHPCSFAVFVSRRNEDVGDPRFAPMPADGLPAYVTGTVREMVNRAWRCHLPDERRRWPRLLLFGKLGEGRTIAKSRQELDAAIGDAVSAFARGQESGWPFVDFGHALGWVRMDDRREFDRVRRLVDTAFRISGPARRPPATPDDPEGKPDRPDRPLERRRRGRPSVVTISAEMRAGVRQVLSGLYEIGTAAYPKIEAGIRDLYRPLVQEAEAYLGRFGGKDDFATYEDKLAFAQEVQRWLETHGLCVECQACRRPAFLRCRKTGRTKKGAFVFEHVESHDLHYGSTAFPQHLTVRVRFPSA